MQQVENHRQIEPGLAGSDGLQVEYKWGRTNEKHLLHALTASLLHQRAKCFLENFKGFSCFILNDNSSEIHEKTGIVLRSHRSLQFPVFWLESQSCFGGAVGTANETFEAGLI